FGDLHGKSAGNMWRMLISSQKGKEFIVSFCDVKCDEQTGSAHWEAHYNFSKTGRKVHNRIDAQFKIKDGLIIEHIDDFNLHSWSKQALGTSGMLLGWTGFFKKKLQVQTNALLKKYESTI
ncbi:MAG: nuclear transport factor 2 family protein, partial [Flavobacteriales bacterium]